MSRIIFSSAALNALVEGLASAVELEVVGIPDTGAVEVPGLSGIVEFGAGAGCCAIAGLVMAANTIAARRILEGFICVFLVTA